MFSKDWQILIALVSWTSAGNWDQGVWLQESLIFNTPPDLCNRRGSSIL